MDQIQHKYIETRGLKLHIAEIGTGDSVVVFLHGFPEIWYSWRYQMIVVSNTGFRAIGPDFRGYGLSDIPFEPEKATFSDLVQDTLAILIPFTSPREGENQQQRKEEDELKVVEFEGIPVIYEGVPK